MPVNLSNFDAFEDNFIDELRVSMEKLGNIGEAYVKGKHSGTGLDYGVGNAGWNDDTASLLASVSGFEAKTGDYAKNFDDSDWARAQAVGSQQYPYNKPEHYEPHVESRDLGEGDNPVAVLTFFTKYPDSNNSKDAGLEAAVVEALSDAGQYMQTQLVRAVKDTMRYGQSGILVQGG